MVYEYHATLKVIFNFILRISSFVCITIGVLWLLHKKKNKLLLCWKTVVLVTAWPMITVKLKYCLGIGKQ